MDTELRLEKKPTSANQLIAELSDEQRELLELLLKEEGIDLSQTLIIPEKRESNTFPLSFAQERLWFLQKVEPHNTFYNKANAIRLEGDFNINAFIKALDFIAQRHEILRTTFPSIEGQPYQVIHPVRTPDLCVVDLEELSAPRQESEQSRLCAEETNTPFDLENGTLLRTKLLRLNQSKLTLLLCSHHIILDAWAGEILVSELVTLYNSFSKSEPSPLQDLPVQYADFAAWERSRLQGEILESELTYWKQSLSGSLPILRLPSDRPRQSVQTANGARVRLEISKQITDTLSLLGRQEGATLFMTLLAAYKALLYRYTGELDILVGTPIANRNRKELEGLLGMFSNTLVLRTKLAGNITFRELISRVREVALGGYAHQGLPFEKLVEELNPVRSLSHTPLFQVWFALQNTDASDIEMSSISFSAIEVDSRASQFELTLDLSQTPSGLKGSIDYNSDLFDEETIERMASHYSSLLKDVCLNPDKKLFEIELLEAQERFMLLAQFNGATAAFDRSARISDLFSRQAESSPEAIALEFESLQLSFRELDRRSNQLARCLRQLGTGPEVKVGICMRRSIEFYVSLLAALKAGGAYVPIDLNHPRQRQIYMLEDAQVEILLTRRTDYTVTLQRQLPIIEVDHQWDEICAASAERLESNALGDNTAVIMYTSGSTGHAKGVEITHSNIVNYSQIVAEEFGLSGNDRMLQLASAGFDVSIEETFPLWIRGGTVVSCAERAALSGRELVAQLQARKITVVELPTAYWESILKQMTGSEGIGDLRLVIVGCEGVKRHLYEEWKKLPIALMQVYGLTETSVTTTVYKDGAEKATGGSMLPIGRVVRNTEVYILGEAEQISPIGIAGEIYIGGPGLARGYFGKPDLTARRFVPNPFSHEPGARLYRTGDIGRYLADGNIEFLGRTDDQVKLRGYRIEVGEIEATLKLHEQVADAVVVIKHDSSGDRRLVAYYVRQDGLSSNLSDMRSFLKERLPSYMVPSIFVRLDAMPLTSNGKVNKPGLPEPKIHDSHSDTDFIAPSNNLERTIAEVWQDCLRTEKVGRNDNFFDLGGHSLMTFQVQNKLEQIMGMEIPVIDLFKFPTISSLAEHISKLGSPSSFEHNYARAEMRRATATNLFRARQRLKRESASS